jgi:hypothetical protein
MGDLCSASHSMAGMIGHLACCAKLAAVVLAVVLGSVAGRHQPAPSRARTYAA